MKRFYPSICTALIAIGLLLWPACYSVAEPRAEAMVRAIGNDAVLHTTDGHSWVLADWVWPDLGPKDVLALREKLGGKDWSYEVQETDRYDREVVYLYDEAGALQTQWQGGMVYSDITHPHTLAQRDDDAATAFTIEQQEASRHLNQYRVVTGRVVQVTVLRDQAFLNFDADWKTDFSIMVPRDTLRKMTPAYLSSLQGKMVKVRGYIHAYYGPRITLINPDMLELYETESHRP